MQIASTLGIKQVPRSPYYHQENGYMENLHDLLKTCTPIHVSLELEWDEVTHIGYEVYSFSKICILKKALFSSRGQDALYIPLVQLLNPNVDPWVMKRVLLFWMFLDIYMS